MNVRRYTARDMRDAMRQVRELQGPDAVILSSRRVKGMLEVVAALEEEFLAPEAQQQTPPEPVAAPQTMPPAEDLQPRRAEIRDATPPPARASVALPVDPELAAMRRELYDLRSLLVERQSSSENARWSERHPLAAELLRRLARYGFDEKLGRSLVGGVQEGGEVDPAWERLRARLSASIATVQPSVLEHGGMLALVGPTGVGKTTTIVRLALRQLRRMGRDSVTLVSLDHQLLGAYRQLQAFGQMAGINVIQLEHERDLAALSGRARDGRLVLIDTAGQAARDAAEQRLFAQVREEIALETWLVIAATHQARVMRRVLDAFAASNPSALVLTKVDESDLLGETLSVLMEQRLGLVFYSDGQHMSDDFHKADSLYLTRLALQERGLPAASFGPLDAMPRGDVSTHSSAPAPDVDGLLLESVLPFRVGLHAAC